MGKIMIRAMELSDIPRAAEIHIFGWRNAYRGIISDDFLFNKLSVVKSINRFENQMQSNEADSYVYDDGIIKAFMTIGQCRDIDKLKAFELWGIYVEPFFIRQGVGSQMIKYCEEIALNRSYKEMCLWVLEENENAIKFYEKSGYYADGEKKYIDFLGVVEIRYVKYI